MMRKHYQLDKVSNLAVVINILKVYKHNRHIVIVVDILFK